MRKKRVKKHVELKLLFKGPLTKSCKIWNQWLIQFHQLKECREESCWKFPRNVKKHGMNRKINLGVLEEELYEKWMKARDKLNFIMVKRIRGESSNQIWAKFLFLAPSLYSIPKLAISSRRKTIASNPLESKCGHGRKLSILLMEIFQMDDAFSFI